MRLGGRELKIPKFALLMLSIGLLIQIPAVSAQEEEAAAIDPYRLAEMEYTISEGSAGIEQEADAPLIWPVIRMVLVLLLVAVAVYGVVFIIKRDSKPAAAVDPFLKVLASTPLGYNRYAHIVAAGSKAWLVGAGESGVNLISEIEDKDLIDAMMLEDSKKSVQSPGKFPDFVSLLRKFGAPAQKNASGADEIRKRRERLRGL